MIASNTTKTKNSNIFYAKNLQESFPAEKYQGHPKCPINFKDEKKPFTLLSPFIKETLMNPISSKGEKKPFTLLPAFIKETLMNSINYKDEKKPFTLLTTSIKETLMNSINSKDRKTLHPLTRIYQGNPDEPHQFQR